MKRKAIDVGLISKSESTKARLASICEEFEYSFHCWAGLEEFMDSGKDCAVAIVEVGDSGFDPAECCQATKGINGADSFTVVCVDKKIKPESIGFLKKSGADLVLLNEEIHGSSKLEFILTQELKAKFYPIKASDLAVGPIDFGIYHYVSHREKFLPCVWADTVITENKLAKVAQVGEVYVIRNEAMKYSKYMEANKSSVGAARRCRAKFLSLCASFIDLVYLLSDQGEAASFDKGKQMLEMCREMCKDLISVVASSENPWSIVDSSAIGNLGSVERSTAIATYVAAFGLTIDEENIEDSMLAALLSDMGMLKLPPKIMKKVRSGDSLKEDEQVLYNVHPMSSVSMLLDRKIPLKDEMRKVMEMTHERKDGRGFPRRPLPDRIPQESQLIQFCTEFDQATLLRAGRQRVNMTETLREMALAESAADQYTADFIEKIKRIAA